MQCESQEPFCPPSYLVYCLLSSWTSISTLLYSLSSFRIAAYKIMTQEQNIRTYEIPILKLCLDIKQCQLRTFMGTVQGGFCNCIILFHFISIPSIHSGNWHCEIVRFLVLNQMCFTVCALHYNPLTLTLSSGVNLVHGLSALSKEEEKHHYNKCGVAGTLSPWTAVA